MTEYVHNPVWDFHERLKIDNSIDLKNLLPVQVDTGCNFDYNSQIRFTLTGGDAYIVPSESFLYIEGRLIKNDGTPIGKDPQGYYPNILLANNGPMFLFRDVKYTIDDVEVESFSRPGFATLIKGLLTKSSSYRALNQCWALDNYDGQANPMTNYTSVPNITTTQMPAVGAVPTAAEYTAIMRIPVTMFNVINSTTQVEDFPLPCVGANPTAAEVQTGFNNMIAALNHNLDAPTIEGVTVPDNTVANIRIGITQVQKNINKALETRMPTDWNTGFAARKMLLFNPIESVTPAESSGMFSFYIPLNFIFDFCEDYDKVVYHRKHQLIMTRDFTDSYAVFKSRFYSGAVWGYDGKIAINSMKLYVKQLIPSAEQREIMNSIPKTVSIAFRNKYIQSSFVPQGVQVWPLELTYNGGFGVPQYIIVGFQVMPDWAAGVDQQVNNSLFNNPLEEILQINVRNVRITINNNTSISNDYSCDFRSNRASQFYKDFKDMRKLYSGVGEEDNCVDLTNFINLYRLYTFDISSPAITRDAGTVTVVLEFNFVTATPNRVINYYALTFYDKEVVV